MELCKTCNRYGIIRVILIGIKKEGRFIPRYIFNDRESLNKFPEDKWCYFFKNPPIEEMKIDEYYVYEFTPQVVTAADILEYPIPIKDYLKK